MMAEHPYCEVMPKEPPSEQIGTLLRAVEAVAAEDAKREMKASSQGSAEPISDCYFPRCKAGRMQGSLPAMIEQGSGPASVSPPATVPSDEELACGEERYLRGRIPPSGE